MSYQCGLCLSCGAPFLPIAEDMINYDSLGNISVFYFQRMVANNRDMKHKIVNPTFTGTIDKSHLIHVSHHRAAIEEIVDWAQYRRQTNMSITYKRSPKGKRPVSQKAYWTWNVPNDERINLNPLADYLTKTYFTRKTYSPNYERTVECCKPCNAVMTMRFWYTYHL